MPRVSSSPAQLLLFKKSIGLIFVFTLIGQNQKGNTFYREILKEWSSGLYLFLRCYVVDLKRKAKDAIYVFNHNEHQACLRVDRFAQCLPAVRQGHKENFHCELCVKHCGFCGYFF